LLEKAPASLMNNGLFKILAMVAIVVACGNTARGSIVLQSGGMLGGDVQQMSGVSSEVLAVQAGAGAASRHLDDDRPHREAPHQKPYRELGLCQPAHGGAMEGTGGGPGYRTIVGDYALMTELVVTQEDSLVYRIQGEFKLVLPIADPLGLLRPPEVSKLQSFLS
jgi:hypothetical protein